jgi:CRISPR-associated protein Csb3
MTNLEPGIRVTVDPTNPGQFFACCGLLELADRLWGGAEGWFEVGAFCIASAGALSDLIECVSTAEVQQLDPEDNTGSPMKIGNPFRPLRLEWWHDERAGGKDLKVWAGTMESVRIAQAMQCAMRDERFLTAELLNVGVVAYDRDNPSNKVEPFYFDARRTPNAHSRDVGFSPNDLKITTTAFPAVEFLCLVGLQRCLPLKSERPRVFDYFTWPEPLPPPLLPAAISGLMQLSGQRGYRFENWYRTGQKKHKAFRSATPIPLRGD